MDEFTKFAQVMSYISFCGQEGVMFNKLKVEIVQEEINIFTSAWSILSSRRHEMQKSKKEEEEKTLGKFLEIWPDHI